MLTCIHTSTDGRRKQIVAGHLVLLIAGLWLLTGLNTAHAATFTFNFASVSGATTVGKASQSCGRFGNNNCDMESGSNPDGQSSTPTDWLNQIVTIGGVKYWHMVVGDPLDGFALEYYVQQGTVNPDYASNADFIDGNFSSNKVGDGAGFIPFDFDQGFSTSGGNCWRTIGFACRPLGHNPEIQANGYQNPTKVAMKQLTFDSELTFDFEKSEIAEKPKITQIVANSEITLEFKADMSAGNHSSMGAVLPTSSNIADPQVFVNRLIHADGNPPQPPGQDSVLGLYDFDYAHDAVNTVRTAGQYTFTPGLGWSNSRPNITYRSRVADFNSWGIGNGKIYDKGTYAYIGGAGLDLNLVKWEEFMDPAQNPCGGDPWCGVTPGAMPQ